MSGQSAENPAPRPRAGLAGTWDRLMGPGLTATETAMAASIALAAAAGVLIYAVYGHPGWNWLQVAVVALIAFDLAGGIFANATSAAKRWYHRPGQGAWQHFAFTAAHIHPLIVSWLFLSVDWAYFLIAYGYLLLAALAILAMPRYLRRPVALTIYAGGLLVSFYALPQILGLEWFLPFLYLKLLVGHLLKETPYAPPGK